MIDQFEKITCNGCKACKELCPQKAITYECDSYGFWFPKVDYTKCVKCGNCVKKCPNKSQPENKYEMPDVKAAWSNDSEVRLGSTSGGLFYELAKAVLQNNGYVAGCVYDKNFKGAHHVIINSISDLKPLMVSKYVESDTEGIYSKVKDALQTRNRVMFVGSPCQCAGLQVCLDRKYDNLITVDFLCRGANSPKAHRKYVEYLENEFGGKMVSLRSKDKRNGWEHFGQAATFDNGKEYYASRDKDLRVVAYHRGNLMVRESCSDCKFKTLPRYADITLGDFWGIKSEEVEDIDKGVSLCFINSKKGRDLLDEIKNEITCIDKSLEEAKKGNMAIYSSATYSANRDAFLSSLDMLPFDKLVAKYKTKDPSVFKRGMNKIYRIIGGRK